MVTVYWPRNVRLTGRLAQRSWRDISRVVLIASSRAFAPDVGSTDGEFAKPVAAGF